MLHTKFLASEPSGSKEDLLIFSMYMYCSNPEPPAVGPFWTLGLQLEQIW